MASRVCFVRSGVAVAAVFSGSSEFSKQSFCLLLSPFISSISDVPGGLAVDGATDGFVVEAAVNATGETYGQEHRDSSSWYHRLYSSDPQHR